MISETIIGSHREVSRKESIQEVRDRGSFKYLQITYSSGKGDG